MANSAGLADDDYIHPAVASYSGVVISDEHSGSDNGYIDFTASSNAWITWTFDLGESGTLPLSFRYALGSGGATYSRSMALEVNGVIVEHRLEFLPTNSFSNWATLSYNAALQAGTNTVRLIATGVSGPNIDGLTVGPPASPGSTAPFTLQAENAVLAGAVVANNHEGATGWGFADFQNASGDSLMWRFTASEAGEHEITLRYALNGTSSRVMALEVNGVVVDAAFAFTATGSWTVWTDLSIEVPLIEGTNSVRLIAIGQSGPNIDSLTIAPFTEEPSSSFALRNEPVERVDASDGTKYLSPDLEAFGSGHIAVWSETGRILAQRFDADGAKVGGAISFVTQSANSSSAVAVLSDGSFVIVWDEPSAPNVYARHFYADGSAAGSPFLVSEDGLGNGGPSVTALTDGGYAIVWRSYRDPSDTGSGYDVKMQVFGADGDEVSSEIVINDTTLCDTLGEVGETITQLANGNIAASWYSDQYEGLVLTRVFTSSGEPVSAEHSAGLERNQDTQPSIAALADGGYVLVFTTSSTFGGGYSVNLQLFNADGTSAGTPQLVSTDIGGYQIIPRVEALEGGGFIVIWQSDGLEADMSTAISGQRFDANGIKVGEQMLFNAPNGVSEQWPDLTVRDDGTVIVAWSTGSEVDQMIIPDWGDPSMASPVGPETDGLLLA